MTYYVFYVEGGSDVALGVVKAKSLAEAKDKFAQSISDRPGLSTLTHEERVAWIEDQLSILKLRSF